MMKTGYIPFLDSNEKQIIASRFSKRIFIAAFLFSTGIVLFKSSKDNLNEPFSL